MLYSSPPFPSPLLRCARPSVRPPSSPPGPAAGPGQPARRVRRSGESGLGFGGHERSRTPNPNLATEEPCCLSRPRVLPGRSGCRSAGRPGGLRGGLVAAVAAGSWCVAGWRSVVRGGGRGPGGRCGVWRVVVRGVGCRSVAVGSGAGRGRWSRVGVAVRWSGGRRVGLRVRGVAGGAVSVLRRCRSCLRGSCLVGRCGPVRALAWGCAGSGRWSWSFRTPAARGVLGRAAGNGPEGNPGRNNHGSLLRRTPTSRIQSPIRFQRYPTKTPFSVVAEPGQGPSASRWSGGPILDCGPGPIR